MLQPPDLKEIMDYGRALGLDLTAAEARIMRDAMINTIASLEAFDRLSIEEHRPQLRYPNRDGGYRPKPEEDPLNAFIWKCRIQGSGDGPLRGKQVGMRDHISVAGVPLTLGRRFMEDHIPDFDATVVTRVLDAGGTITGKMNLHSSSDSGDFGRILNPHLPDHRSGGSSAAAVAAGYLDIAFGADQGGSIRIPSSWCGVLGLKPTFGLVPHTGCVGPDDPTLDYVGPMARTVEYLAAALESVAGVDGFDWRQAKVPLQLPEYTQIMKKGVGKLTIGILSEGFGSEGSDPEVERTVLDALSTIEDAGAHLEQVSIPVHLTAGLVRVPLHYLGGKRFFDTNLGGAFFMDNYYPTSLVSTVGGFKQSHAQHLPPREKLSLVVGAYLEQRDHGRLYAKAQNMRPTLVRQYDQAFSKVDLIAMPTVPITAPLHEEPRDAEEALREVLGRNQGWAMSTRNTSAFNLTGHPAINVPCGKLKGLPVGLMLVAPQFREDLLLRAAYTYQHSVDWLALFPGHSEEAPRQT